MKDGGHLAGRGGRGSTLKDAFGSIVGNIGFALFELDTLYGSKSLDITQKSLLQI